MKENLVELLRCPCCAGALCIGEVNDRDVDEITCGMVRCCSCDATYPVSNGSLRMLSKNASVEEEQAGNRKHMEKVRKRIAAYFPKINEDLNNDPWVSELPLYVENGIVRGHPLLASIQYAVELLRDDRIKSVLDLGAGCCWSTYRLAARYEQCIAMEISSEPYVGLDTYHLFRRRGGAHFERIARSAVDVLPFKDGSLDLVTCSAALHHFVPPDAVLREIYRVLRPGGVFLALREPFCSAFESNSKVHDEALRRIGSMEKASTYFEYCRAFHRAGFKFSARFHCNSFLATRLEPSAVDLALCPGGSYPYRKMKAPRRLFYSMLSAPVLGAVLTRAVFPALALLAGNADRCTFVSAYLIGRKPV